MCHAASAAMAFLQSATRPARLYPAHERDYRWRHFATLSAVEGMAE